MSCGATLVVVVTPGHDDLPDIMHIPEPVLVQTGIPETGIEVVPVRRFG